MAMNKQSKLKLGVALSLVAVGAAVMVYKAKNPAKQEWVLLRANDTQNLEKLKAEKDSKARKELAAKLPKSLKGSLLSVVAPQNKVSNLTVTDDKGVLSVKDQDKKAAPLNLQKRDDNSYTVLNESGAETNLLAVKVNDEWSLYHKGNERVVVVNPEDPSQQVELEVPFESNPEFKNWTATPADPDVYLLTVQVEVNGQLVEQGTLVNSKTGKTISPKPLELRVVDSNGQPVGAQPTITWQERGVLVTGQPSQEDTHIMW